MADADFVDPKVPEKGSYVKKGSILIQAKPFAYVLSSKFRGECCDHCLKRGKTMKCSGCNFVYYCGRRCQKKSWSLHRVECPEMLRVFPRELPDTLRLLGRVMIKFASGGRLERGYYGRSEYRIFEDLMSHIEDIRKDSRRLEHFTSAYAVLQSFLPRNFLPTAKEALLMYCRMSINSFHILDEEFACIAVGIYLGPSIINHSCKASASTLFDGPNLTMRAVHDIPSFDWSKVSISYIDVIQSVEERQDELHKSYYFWCKCERCINPEAEASAAACPNKNCPNPCSPEDVECRKCGRAFPPGFSDDFHRVEARTLASLEEIEKMDGEAQILERCRICLMEQEGLLHPLHILQVRVLEAAVSKAAELSLFPKTVFYTRKLTKCYEFYYGSSHPLTGAMYVTLAHVLMEVGKLDEAFKILVTNEQVVEMVLSNPRRADLRETLQHFVLAKRAAM